MIEIEKVKEAKDIDYTKVDIILPPKKKMIYKILIGRRGGIWENETWV